MSYFSSMTVVFGKNDEYFHTITVDSGHDHYIFAGVLNRFENAGYELMSVVIDGYDFREEMLRHIKFFSNLEIIFEALSDDPYQADMICAFIQVNDCADVDNWTDRIYFSGNNHEDVVREWAEVFYRVYEEVSGPYFGTSQFVATTPIPSWMELDWKSTLENIASENDSHVVGFNDSVYYFSNN